MRFREVRIGLQDQRRLKFSNLFLKKVVGPRLSQNHGESSRLHDAQDSRDRSIVLGTQYGNWKSNWKILTRECRGCALRLTVKLRISIRAAFVHHGDGVRPFSGYSAKFVVDGRHVTF